MNINSLLQTGAPSRLIVDSIFYSAIGKSMTVNTTEKYLSQELLEKEIGHINGYKNSIYGIMNRSLTYNSNFTSALSINDATNIAPTVPTLLVSLEKDSIVSVLNTDKYY